MPSDPLSPDRSRLSRDSQRQMLPAQSLLLFVQSVQPTPAMPHAVFELPGSHPFASQQPPAQVTTLHGWHPPPMHTWDPQGAPLAAHWPHASHAAGALATQPPIEPGVHTAADGHEHGPHAHAVEHVCIPYVLHAPVEAGAHAPSFAHVPVHSPVGSHVSASVPQFPQGTVRV
jgi:hypothetical protein